MAYPADPYPEGMQFVEDIDYVWPRSEKEKLMREELERIANEIGTPPSVAGRIRNLLKKCE